MIIDGKKLAEEIKESLRNEVVALGDKKLRLAVVQVGNDPVTEKFLEQKKKFGEAIGIDVRMYKLPEDISIRKVYRVMPKVNWILSLRPIWLLMIFCEKIYFRNFPISHFSPKKLLQKILALFYMKNFYGSWTP